MNFSPAANERRRPGRDRMAALLVAVEAGSIRLAGQRDCAMTPLPRPFEDRHDGARLMMTMMTRLRALRAARRSDANPGVCRPGFEAARPAGSISGSETIANLAAFLWRGTQSRSFPMAQRKGATGISTTPRGRGRRAPLRQGGRDGIGAAALERRPRVIKGGLDALTNAIRPPAVVGNMDGAPRQLRPARRRPGLGRRRPRGLDGSARRVTGFILHRTP